MKNIFLPRTRLNPETDQDIIDWLGSLKGYGAKGLAVKEALRRGFAMGTIGTSREQSHNEAQGMPFNHTECLGDIRRVIDASLENGLARLELSASIREDSQDSALDTDDFFDSFSSLMLD